jgi:hypothetical protein
VGQVQLISSSRGPLCVAVLMRLTSPSSGRVLPWQAVLDGATLRIAARALAAISALRDDAHIKCG